MLLTLVVYFIIKKTMEKEKNYLVPFNFIFFIIFIFISKTLDFFLGISILSIFVSYHWGERRILYLLLISIIFQLSFLYF